MFKMTFFLCAGLFTAMYIGGADRGQQRFGLIEKSPVVAAPVVEAPVIVADMPEATFTPAAIPVSEVAFVPDAPLMITPAVAEAAPVPAVAEPVAFEQGLIMVVNTKSANLRSGPGTDYAVVGRLTQGEAVLVIAQDEGRDGWSLIRIEGDGEEGYIATRLLIE
ncbi:SH3 domain-containing protein [Cypionkella sp.]|uniref:SH3 domain-containing protein n=1 Tax=Cypionkella sp. TaxID=2811411 RepID=UPI002AC9C83E|nr:SH3 domain-containing protein [Cypionkella sp.]